MKVTKLERPKNELSETGKTIVRVSHTKPPTGRSCEIFVQWGITKKFVLRVREEAHVQTDEIAWLQVVKAPLEVRSPRSLVEDLSKRDLTWLREQVELVHSSNVAAHKSHTYLPCLIETKLAEGSIQSSQEFYLRDLLARSEVQPQTYGQTTDEIIQECIVSRLRDKIRLARN